ncbi:hypothetical protein BD560DRAFT_439258 [Blakeslea trispora]|nr:hypothetical protein BD560DRAFT_439258 [Blakeslea trispora]
MPFDRCKDPSSTSTSSSEIPVEVTDITPSPTRPSAQDLSLTHSSPLLITKPSAPSVSDIDPPPPQSTASCPPESSVVVQRRTRNQGGDNVMVTNSGYRSNEVNLDFANTEEIPVFLRNWNVNKKRKFKPKPSNCNPAKRQRRSGPDSHNHSHSINRLSSFNIFTTTPKRTSTAAKFSGGRRSTVSWDPTITAVDWTDEMLAMSPVDHTGRPSYLL